MKTGRSSNDQRLAILLRWYSRHARDLPWRRTDDAYAIFVSEIMLQQTQVSRVISIFEAWIKRFPNWTTLAQAKTPELLRAWAGLGYNRRALYLRESARTVIESGVPRTIDDWARLKGVGPYTAAAVHTFVSKQPSAAIDTNVRRVIGRLTLGLASPSEKADARIRSSLRSMFKQSPKAWKALHAMMDLGSMICTPRSPKCSICPLRDACLARPKFERGIRTKKKKVAREKIHKGKKFPDRIYRGRILALARTKKNISIASLGRKIDQNFDAHNDSDWLLRMLDRMRKDGLIQMTKGHILISKE
ncbi:MAG: A/G-specific adenine glycosylase [Patescibacteria group bacterium]